MLLSYLISVILSSSVSNYTPTTVPFDSDNDGLTDVLEYMLDTDMFNADTDNDGYSDWEEIINGYNPLSAIIGDRQVIKRVEIDLCLQQLHYFFNDVKIGSYYVSTGRLNAKTPIGEFEILRKVPVKHYWGVGVSYPNTKWNLEFKKTYYIHSAWWHNDFGVKPKSGGCINMTVPDAEQIYRFLDVGDKVVIYGQTPIQPLMLDDQIKINHNQSASVPLDI